jgi:hypothetical protein
MIQPIDAPAPTSRVLAASIYPARAAATRLRLEPINRALRQMGLDVDLWTFLDDADLRPWLAGGIGRLSSGARGSARVPAGLTLAARCSLLLLQREALPLNSLQIEKRALNDGRPLIWDVDDALWSETSTRRSLVRGRSTKYEWLARHATEVWAGNRTVADWAVSKGAKNVSWVPTTVAIPSDLSSVAREPDLLVWIGTPSTGPYLEALLNCLGDALKGWRILVVGARIDAPAVVDLTQIEWSPEAEAAALARGAIGLYPLDMNQATAGGKSALKSVLFMAHGIPVIATPSRSNRDVMQHGDQGFFAESRHEWLDHLETLRDPDQQLRMGARGRQHAAANFDSAKWGHQLAKRIVDCLYV